MLHIDGERLAREVSVITPGPATREEVKCGLLECERRFVPKVRVFRDGRQEVQRFCHAKHRSLAWMRLRLARTASDPDQARRRFRAWLASPAGRVVYGEVVRHAYLLLDAGFKRYGIAAIWEVIRYDASLGRIVGPVSLPDGRRGGDYRLNNVYRAFIAREVEANEPALRGFFTKREAMADGGVA